MFSSFSTTTVLALVLIFQNPVVGARSPYFTTRQAGSNHFHHYSRNSRERTIVYTTASNNINDDIFHQDHLRRLDPEKLSSMQSLQKLRGGEVSGATSACKVSLLIDSLDVFGTAVFAFSGALKAGRKGMDLIGMMIIACITAVGGGTLRDVLMMGGGEEHVVFWMETPMYLEISLITALLTFYFWPKLEAKFGLEADSAFPICTSDALGLAAFCVVGVQAAARRKLAPTLWVVSGLMTATFGGIIRDVICGEQPRIMYPHRTLYALGPALGALTYAVLDNLKTTQSLPLTNSSITMVSFLVAFVVRVLSFNKPWRMPHWDVTEGKSRK